MYRNIDFNRFVLGIRQKKLYTVRKKINEQKQKISYGYYNKKNLRKYITNILEEKMIKSRLKRTRTIEDERIG